MEEGFVHLHTDMPGRLSEALPTTADSPKRTCRRRVRGALPEQPLGQPGWGPRPASWGQQHDGPSFGQRWWKVQCRKTTEWKGHRRLPVSGKRKCRPIPFICEKPTPDSADAEPRPSGVSYVRETLSSRGKGGARGTLTGSLVKSKSPSSPCSRRRTKTLLGCSEPWTTPELCSVRSPRATPLMTSGISCQARRAFKMWETLKSTGRLAGGWGVQDSQKC